MSLRDQALAQAAMALATSSLALSARTGGGVEDVHERFAGGDAGGLDTHPDAQGVVKSQT
jgi:hypothetical protein